MRIDNIHIEGFGRFANYDIGLLETPITVFYGPNEAGKSTLLAFIRSILFGFPTRHGAQHYPPLAGGSHGGSITIVDQNRNSYTVRRVQGSGTGPLTMTNGDGQTFDETVLRPLLGHHSKDVFESIFAFTLDELHSNDLLENEKVNSQIYSAGMGALTLPDALKRIENERNGLFLKGGSKQEIAEVAKELRDIESKLNEVANNAARFGDLSTKLESVEKDRKQLDMLRRQHQSNLECQRRLERAWDDWNDFVTAEQELVDMKVISDFPDDGVSRLERLEEGIRKAMQEYETAFGDVADAKSKAEVGIEHEDILEQSDIIRSLERGRERFDSAVRDLPERKTELEERERLLDDTLKDIDPEWDDVHLEEFDLSIAVREEISKYGESLRKADADLERYRADLAQDKKALREATEAVNAAKRDLEGIRKPSLDEEQARQRRKLIREANLRLFQKESTRKRLSELQEQLDALVRHASPGLWRNNQKAIAVGGILFGLALLVGGILYGESALPWIVIVALTVIGMAAYLFSTGSSPNPDVESPLASPIQESLIHSKAELGKLQSVLEQTKAALGFATIDEVSLISAEDSLDDEEALMREWASLCKAFEGAEKLTKHRKSRMDQSEEDVAVAKAQLETTQREWGKWLRAHGLRDTLVPQTVVELQRMVELGLARLRDVRDWKERIGIINKSIDDYIDQVEPLTLAFAIPCDRNALRDVAAAADRLVELRDEVQNIVRKRTEAEEALKKAKHRLEERDGDLRKAKAEMEDLLSSGEASGVEEFRRRGKVYQEREDLKEKRREALYRLQHFSGPGEHLEALQKTLRDTDIQTIKDSARQSEEQQEAVETGIRELDTKRGSIETELQTLTSEEESSRLRTNRSILLEQMREHAQEWAKGTLAERLLEEARSTFERERQPGVVRHAEAFFSEITDGRYDKVAAPLGQKTIRVAGADGLGKEPSTLSRGTREQLFLSLRFGLVRELGERTEPLPVIVDEVLVNFDPERALRAAKAFTELSHSNQVLVFTCHPTIVEHFQEAANQLESPEPKVIQIN